MTIDLVLEACMKPGCWLLQYERRENLGWGSVMGLADFAHLADRPRQRLDAVKLHQVWEPTRLAEAAFMLRRSTGPNMRLTMRVIHVSHWRSDRDVSLDVDGLIARFWKPEWEEKYPIRGKSAECP